VLKLFLFKGELTQGITMLTEKQVYAQFNQLSEEAKQEIINYLQFLLHQQTPESPPKLRKRVFGSASGKYQLTADFDAPLEDFKEYMP
jgi:hypothetical protein